jgi:hypothetical protein
VSSAMSVPSANFISFSMLLNLQQVYCRAVFCEHVFLLLPFQHEKSFKVEMQATVFMWRECFYRRQVTRVYG